MPIIELAITLERNRSLECIQDVIQKPGFNSKEMAAGLCLRRVQNGFRVSPH